MYDGAILKTTHVSGSGFYLKVGENMARTIQINNAENKTDNIAITGVIY